MSPTAGALDFLERELDDLRKRELLRSPVAVGEALVLCSNDYLGLASTPPSFEGGASGAGASRLVSGNHPSHADLERALAEWVGLPEALLFSSGYAANVGVLGALANEHDVIVSDSLNHASIIDGCRLSRASVVVAPHLDVRAVDRALSQAAGARRRFVVTEAYFSMDGDVPDLVELRRTCDRHGAALIVDEAHSLGIAGARGGGCCREAGVVPDVLVGTLGKAVGLQGAFVAGSDNLKAWLWNRARSFVFSTGVSPWLAGSARDRVARVIADDAARARLSAVVETFRGRLSEMGAPIAPSRGPIIPWIVGDAARAVELRDRLLARGLYVQAIRPPTVPEGSSRLRITLHARLSDEQLEFALAALGAAASLCT